MFTNPIGIWCKMLRTTRNDKIKGKKDTMIWLINSQLPINLAFFYVSNVRLGGGGAVPSKLMYRNLYRGGWQG